MKLMDSTHKWWEGKQRSQGTCLAQSLSKQKSLYICCHNSVTYPVTDVAPGRLKSSHYTVRVILTVINVRHKGEHGFGSVQVLQNKSEHKIRLLDTFEFIMGFCQNIESNTTRNVWSSMRLPHLLMDKESVMVFFNDTVRNSANFI